MRRRARLGIRVMVLVVFALAAAGSVFYARPVECLRAWQHVQMRIDGVEGSWVTVNGVRMRSYVRGPVDGKPVVLVHGLGGSAEDWLKIAPYLVKAGYRVYTPDLPGYGESEQPRSWTYSIPEEAGAVVGYMDALGLKQVDLAGWSMGGWIVQRVAAEHPERIRRLTIFDSAGLKLVPEWDTRLFTPRNREEVDALDTLLFPKPPVLAEFVVRDVVRNSKENGWVIQSALKQMLTAKDVTDASLPQLKMPMLILWGDADRITPMSEGRTMHGLVPQSHLGIAPGCGHMAPVECSTSFGPELVRFLGAEPAVAGGETVLKLPI